MMTKITIIMPVHNRPEFLSETIESIIKQSFKDFELLIIDDGSDKKTKSKLKFFKDKRIKIQTNNENIGLTKSLNKALEVAKGEFIARIDNGDICNKDRLKKELNHLNKTKSALTGSYINLIDEKGKKIGSITYPTKDKDIKDALIRTNTFTHSTLMIRKKVLDEVGFYDEKFYYSQDYELILRIGSKYKLTNTPEFLVDYRYDPKGITASPEKRKKQDWFALKARWIALTKYGYSWKYLFDFKIAFIEYMIPFRVKKILLKLLNKEGKININMKGKKITFDNSEL